ncbi:MAG TPA: hypothetical protein VLH18_05680 [Candidatus Limnocylindrales bacterium]|nr:hypothetical protein [Candidatus Limnocylindrales bacterium]
MVMFSCLNRTGTVIGTAAIAARFKNVWCSELALWSQPPVAVPLSLQRMRHLKTVFFQKKAAGQHCNRFFVSLNMAAFRGITRLQTSRISSSEPDRGVMMWKK